MQYSIIGRSREVASLYRQLRTAGFVFAIVTAACPVSANSAPGHVFLAASAGRDSLSDARTRNSSADASHATGLFETFLGCFVYPEFWDMSDHCAVVNNLCLFELIVGGVLHLRVCQCIPLASFPFPRST